MRKTLFLEKRIKVGEQDFTQFLTRNCISKQNISSIKIYLTRKYRYTCAVENLRL